MVAGAGVVRPRAEHSHRTVLPPASTSACGPGTNCVTLAAYDAVWAALQGAARRFRRSPTPDNLAALQEAAAAFGMVADGYVCRPRPPRQAKRRSKATGEPNGGRLTPERLRARAEAARYALHQKYADEIALGHIPLTGGMFAFVDVEDVPLVLGCKWMAHPHRSKFRASAHFPGSGGHGRSIFMHHLILPPVPGLMVDHIDGDPLNNRRSNLRYASGSQNAQNTTRRPGTSRYRGVTFIKGCWDVSCGSRRNSVREYGFPSEEAAGRRYDELALKIYGPGARLNFPKANDNAA